MSKFWYFTPEGWPAQRVMTRGWQSADIDKCGQTPHELEYSSGDFPDMEMWGDGVITLCDEAADDWLLHHCRLVEVYDGFDVNDFSRYQYGAPDEQQALPPPLEP